MSSRVLQLPQEVSEKIRELMRVSKEIAAYLNRDFREEFETKMSDIIADLATYFVAKAKEQEPFLVLSIGVDLDKEEVTVKVEEEESS